MPNPAHSGIQGDPWHFCDRCGLAYRISQLAWQEGILVCTATCYDSQTTRERDIQIARCLDEATLYPDAQVDPKLTENTSGVDEGE